MALSLKKNMHFKTIAALVLVVAALPSVGGEMRSLKSVGEAVKLAEDIPVTGDAGGHKNVAQRMKAAGITITGGRTYSYDSKPELEAPSDRVGDVHFHINSSEPPDGFKRSSCNMSGDAAFLKRGGKYYPESRTANWLMTGECSTNFAKPPR
jgi:hypothetical protein